MKRICVHHTAGGMKATEFDRRFYHELCDGDGVIIKGHYPIEANKSPLRPGRYAAHCGGGNSDAIGFAFCGMSDLVKTRTGYRVEKHPLNQKQFEAGCKRLAELCKGYGILPHRTAVYTHYEFGKAHPNTSSRGKIDIVYLPFAPGLAPDEVGDYLRNKVSWYLNRIT